MKLFINSRKNIICVCLMLITVTVIFHHVLGRLHEGNRHDLDSNPVAFTVARSNVSLTTHFGIPGIGNVMFQYAAMYGIARTTRRIPLVPDNFILLRYFELTSNRSRELRPGLSWGKMLEAHSNQYDGVFETTALRSPHDLELVGYFQSWVYFHDHEDDLRREFRFRPSITKEISLLKERAGIFTESANGSFVVVGVHVRRGDMLFPALKKFGYTVADASYIERAMRLFESRYGDVRFLVTSDDITWCRRHVVTDKRRVWFSENNAAITDLALLASCDHVIMTVGTFGWWAAWLADGDTVYYKEFPRPGSRLAQSFSKSKADYFPAFWTPL